MSEQYAEEITFLKGNRVTLRPPIEADIPHLLRWLNNQEVTQYLNTYLPLFEADEREWLNSLHKKKNEQVVLAIVVDGKPIGNMGLHKISWKDRIATTGAVIGEKEYRDKGYGTEAKMLLLDYAFNRLNLRKICSSVLEFNARSKAYQEKTGYKEEGRLRKQRYVHGKYWDEILMALFREDWEPVWEAYREKHGIKKPGFLEG